MLRRSLAIAASAAFAVMVTSCAGPESRSPLDQPDPSVASPPEGPPRPVHSPRLKGFQGPVLETMDAAGYTYVCVDTGGERLWAAAPETRVKVGDPVVVPAGMLMVDFFSKTLKRKFDVIYFVAGLEVQTAAAAPDDGAARTAVEDPAANMDFTGIAKPHGGMTIAEILAAKSDLAGKTVSLRAKVVKFTPKVMGVNWLHVADGTGVEDAKDLTVTAQTKAKVGDTVLVSGVVAIDKDFGFGYRYAVIVENAKVVVEP